MTVKRLLIPFALLLLAPLQAFPASSVSEQHFTVSLSAESDTPAPGKPLTVAVQLRPAPGWHTYWKNPGQTGFPAQAQWTLPAGITAGKLKFPLPTEQLVDGFRSNVLEGRVTWLTDIAIPAKRPRGSLLPIGLKLRLAICSMGQCMPRNVALNLTLRTGNGAPDPDKTGLFRTARAALPVSLASPASYQADKSNLILSLPLAASARITAAHVFFDGDGIVAGGVQRFESSDGKITITMPRGNIKTGADLTGVIRIIRSGRRNGNKSIRGYSFIAHPAAVAH